MSTRPAKQPGEPRSHSPSETLVENAEIYTPARRIGRGWILMRGGKIAALGAGRPGGRAASRTARVIDAGGKIAVPGFIDLHVHGGDGADFMDEAPGAAARVLGAHLRGGTTSLAPTLMTASHARILAAIRAVRAAAESSGAAGLPEILGLHLEGPYIAGDKRGAQPLEDIRPYAAGELNAYCRAAGPLRIRLMTLAPEAPRAAALIAALRARGIVASAGHSSATYGQAVKGIAAGIRHGTHLFNAMTGLFHRDPGLAGALLLDGRATVELIADGIHLHPAVLELVLRIKPLDRIVLVTDATRLAGRGSKPLRTADGALYGSALTLDDALRNLVRWSGRPLAEILPMLTSTPARILGVARRKGRLAAGADADVVLLSHELRVHDVFLGGKQILIAR